MKYTSAEAAKLLRRLNDDYYALISMEERSRDFLAAMGEDVESVRPEYDYEKTQEKLSELEAQIRTVKHAINVFNSTHTVEGFDMTIDAMLIFIPQLSRRKEKLFVMKSRLPKVRENAYGRNTTIIDYRYINYDLSKVEEDYRKVSDLLAKAQTALDVVNTTATMEIDL